MTPRPTPQERKALRARYTPQKKLLHFTVIHCGKVVFDGAAGLCEWFIKENGLKGAYKKAKK